jgi:ABC-type multidrug transport system ATPase subunit
MITVDHLVKTYPGNIHALADVSLRIAGGMFGLIGANGAGKTTLMRILACLVRPTGGKIEVLGHDLATVGGRTATKSILGYLPQELGLYPSLSAREFLDYLAILKGVNDPRVRKQQVGTVLEAVRLTEVADRKLKTYSGGMKRRFGMAQALLGDPQVLIVDEPTVGLDPEERVRLRNLLSEIAQRCTVILSTHIIEDISASCTHLALMYKGQVVYQGTPGEMIASARGHVWSIVTAGPQPNHGVSVVSTLQLQNGIQYRVVGEPEPGAQAAPIEPSLEDGYIWMTRELSRS